MRRATLFGVVSASCGLLFACGLFLACGSDQTTPPDGSVPETGSPDAPMGDAGGDAGVSCDWNKPFGTPTVVSELGTGPDSVLGARLSVDGLTVYFAKAPSDGGTSDLYTATRSSPAGMFGAATVLVGPNTAATEATPSVTDNELTLYFFSTINASPDIFVSIRGSKMSSFSAGMPIPIITSSTLAENGPYVLSDHSALYFAAARDPSGGTDAGGPISVRVFRSPVANGNVGSPVEIDLKGVSFGPVVTPDELTIYFSSNRQGSVGNSDIWFAHRANKADSFGTPMNLSELNMAGTTQQPTFITADLCTLYFNSNRTNSNIVTIWRASR